MKSPKRSQGRGSDPETGLSEVLGGVDKRLLPLASGEAPASPRRAPARNDAIAADHDPAASGESSVVPAWLNQVILRLLLSAAALVFGWWAIQKLSSLLIIVFVSLFLSFAAEPAVNSMERWGLRRGVATGLVFLLVIGASTGFGIAMGQVIAQQLTELVDEAPARIAALETWLQDNIDAEIDLSELQRSASASGEFRSRATEFAGGLVDFGGAVVGALFDLFTIALFTFYLVADGPKLRRTICSLLPPDRQRTVLALWDIGTAKTGGYIASRLILVVIAFGVHWLAFELIGIRFALVLALWVGLVSQFVPVIGTYIAAVLPVFVALADRPLRALWLIVFMVLWQQVENYLVSPRVTSHAMDVHPAVAFGSVIAGTSLLGAVGALLALPVSATIQGFVSTYAARYEVEEAMAAGSLSLPSSTVPADDGSEAPAEGLATVVEPEPND